jgi:two-component system, cell cycle sensor histidine kinase and response regulator CckA
MAAERKSLMNLEEEDKAQLIAEVKRLRKRISQLDQAEGERMRTDQLIRESEERYRRMLNAVTTYTYSVEVSEGRAVSTRHSKACFAITGFSEEDYQHDPFLWYSMIHPADRSTVENAVNDVLAGREVLPFEHRLIRRDGRTIWIRNTMVPYLDKQRRLTRYDGMLEDISTRKHTEDHILYVQKMESLGRMAGAIAHNFNNIIAIILGNAEMVQLGLASDSTARPRIERILEACRRARTITTQITAYTGHMPLTLDSLELSDLISRMAPLLDATIPETIALHYNLAADLPHIAGDIGQVQQMVISLFTNAFEAIGEGRGQVSITTGVREADAEFFDEPHLPKDLRTGLYVTLEIKDDGCGMDETVKARMFDPFFSTKFLGRGLGLPAVLGIVLRHDGFIKFHSEPGAGAAFLIGFPIAGTNPT